MCMFVCIEDVSVKIVASSSSRGPGRSIALLLLQQEGHCAARPGQAVWTAEQRAERVTPPDAFYSPHILSVQQLSLNLSGPGGILVFAFLGSVKIMHVIRRKCILSLPVRSSAHRAAALSLINPKSTNIYFSLKVIFLPQIGNNCRHCMSSSNTFYLY